MDNILFVYQILQKLHFIRLRIYPLAKPYSDNYVSDTVTSGYTWYYLGIIVNVSTANQIFFDSTTSYFFTLDANAKMTHLDGVEIAGSGSGGSGTEVIIRRYSEWENYF